MHAVLATLGTHGDVAPYLGLGCELRRRGHRVTLATNAGYAADAAALGFEFRPLMAQDAVDRLLNDPGFWHPLKGPIIGVQHGARLIPGQYAMLEDLAADPATVFIANPGVFAARIAGEKFGRPLATVILQPWILPSAIAPPTMAFGLTLPTGLPRWMGRAYWRLYDAAADWLVAATVNALRKKLQLAPVCRLPRWWFSPDLILGMFPDWFGGRPADWPRQLKLTGFPAYDGVGSRLPDEVSAFCAASDPPVAFTAGTGMLHAEAFFRDAVAVCQTQNRRGLLMTRHALQVPVDLPESVRHCPFAPFGELFSLCAAVVHHGGAGTTARALAAGTPQVVLPVAWDQPDNARRIAALGVGTWLPSRRRGATALGAALGRVLTPACQQACAAIRQRFDVANPFVLAAGWIEELAAGRARHPAA